MYVSLIKDTRTGKFVGCCRLNWLEKIKDANKDRSNLYEDCVEVSELSPGCVGQWGNFWYILPSKSDKKVKVTVMCNGELVADM